MSTVDETPRVEAQSNGVAEVIEQPKFDKAKWLMGPSDLVEQEVWIDHLNDAVKVRGLTAGQQGSISEQCTTLKGQKITVDQTRIKVLTFSMGVVEPYFDEHEANQIAHKFGGAFELVVGVINAISGATEEDIEKARRRFRPRR